MGNSVRHGYRFQLLVARLIFGAKHPAIPFLLLLAIADDALGLGILAIFYPTGTLRSLEFVVLLGAALGIAVWHRWRASRSFWPYILSAGLVSWFAFYRGGLHPALALVPIIPFVPHARRDSGLFVEGHGHDPLTEFERWWKTPVQVVLLFFGLVNAGCRSRTLARAHGSCWRRFSLESRSEFSCLPRSVWQPDCIDRPASRGEIWRSSGLPPRSGLPWRCSLRPPRFRRTATRSSEDGRASELRRRATSWNGRAHAQSRRRARSDRTPKYN